MRSFHLLLLLLLFAGCGKNPAPGETTAPVETRSVESSRSHRRREWRGNPRTALCHLTSPGRCRPTRTSFAVVVRDGAPLPVDIVLSPDPPVGVALILRLLLTEKGLVAYEIPTGGQAMSVRCDPPVTAERIRSINAELSAETHPFRLQKRNQEISGTLGSFNTGLSVYYGRNEGRYPVRETWTEHTQMSELTQYFSTNPGAAGGYRLEYLAPDTSSYETRITDLRSGLVWSYSSVVGRVTAPPEVSVPFQQPEASRSSFEFSEQIAQMALQFSRQQNRTRYPASLGQTVY